MPASWPRLELSSLRTVIGKRVHSAPAAAAEQRDLSPWDAFFDAPPARDFPDREQPEVQVRRYP
jgi:hypothetical protein